MDFLVHCTPWQPTMVYMQTRNIKHFFIVMVSVKKGIFYLHSQNIFYQSRTVSGHVYACYGYRFCLLLRFSEWFWNCSESVVFFVFHFITICDVTIGNHSDRRGSHSIVVGFTTTYAINAYHHWCCEFESRLGRGVQHYVIKFSVTCDRSVVFSGSSGFLPSIKLTATI
jgi:hypothetical protein